MSTQIFQYRASLKSISMTIINGSLIGMAAFRLRA